VPLVQLAFAVPLAHVGRRVRWDLLVLKETTVHVAQLVLAARKARPVPVVFEVRPVFVARPDLRVRRVFGASLDRLVLLAHEAPPVLAVCRAHEAPPEAAASQVPLVRREHAAPPVYGAPPVREARRGPPDHEGLEALVVPPVRPVPTTPARVWTIQGSISPTALAR